MPPRRICVIGPESTGKTSLAAYLGRELGLPWVPEAARLHAERVARDLTRDDVEPIGREHVEMAARAEAGAAAVVLDTDLISTIVYGRHYYGFHSAWLEATARERLADLYLLCDVDTPWVADGIRDRPEDRAEWFRYFHHALVEFGASITIVRGDWSVREANALAAARSSIEGAAPA